MARDKTTIPLNHRVPPIRRGARGSISRLPSGSLWVRVYAGIHPVTGRQRYLSHTVPDGPTALADAEATARRLVDQVRDRRRPRTDVTVTELLDRHVELVHATDTTRRSYRHTVSKHLQPRLGHLRLAAVTPEVLDYLYAALRRCRDHCDNPRDGRQPVDGHRCRPLQPGTIRKIHYLISGAYRRAVRWGWIDRHPATDASPPRVPHPEPQPPTPAEATRILTAAWADPDLGPLVWLAMATGARRGELCALRWRHVDLTRRVLVIRTSIAQAGSETYEKDTKLHQRRHIALDPRTAAMLATYQQARRHRAAQAGATLTDEGFVFSPRADATSYPVPDVLTRQYHHLVTRLGIRTTLHKLRHYSATELITAGVDLRTVAGRLGHADNGRTTLRHYTAWVNEADQRASHTLMHRLPTPIHPARPGSPYQAIAAELRTAAIGDGTLPPSTVLPTVQSLTTTHDVTPSTAHRSTTLLAHEHLVTADAVAELSCPPRAGAIGNERSQRDCFKIGSGALSVVVLPEEDAVAQESDACSSVRFASMTTGATSCQ